MRNPIFIRPPREDRQKLEEAGIDETKFPAYRRVGSLALLAVTAHGSALLTLEEHPVLAMGGSIIGYFAAYGVLSNLRSAYQGAVHEYNQRFPEAYEANQEAEQ